MLVIKKYMLLMHFGLAFGACRKYSFNVTDACYQTYDTVIHDVDGIRSLTACSSLCAKDNCCSALFDKLYQRCITYSAFARSTVTECGWKYAENVLDICRCHSPNTSTATNQCKHGCSYDVSDNTCRSNCVSYGSTYGRFDGYAINGNNNRVISGSSEQACKDACTAETTFECRTAELEIYDKMCHLSVETALTQPDSYNPVSSYTLWQRNCA